MDEINEYLSKRGTPDYNILDGLPFESPNKPSIYTIDSNTGEKVPKISDGKTLEEFEEYWLNKAKQDEKRIKEYINQLFGKILNNDAKSLENFKNIFIHNSWRDNYFPDKNINIKNQFLEMIGNAAFKVFIANSVVRKTVFSEDLPRKYVIKNNYIAQNYPYSNLLSDIGCKFCLNIGNLKINIDRDLFGKLLGGLCISLPYDAFYNFYKNFLNRD